MPAKDVFHDTVKAALQKNGWIVIRENFRVQVDDEGLAMFIDLTAEKLISAEKAGRKIAVEVKSFRERSDFYQFHAARESISQLSIGIERYYARFDCVLSSSFRNLR